GVPGPRAASWSTGGPDEGPPTLSILGTGGGRCRAPQQQDGEVVGEAFFVGVPFDGRDDARADRRERVVGMQAQSGLEPHLVERPAAGVLRFGDAVAVHGDEIAVL